MTKNNHNLHLHHRVPQEAFTLLSARSVVCGPPVASAAALYSTKKKNSLGTENLLFFFNYIYRPTGLIC
jgi:hypothetical protein